MKPMMDEPEIEALKNLLERQSPKRVLEWGGGGSTVYWSNLYPDIDWVTIEHNPVWIEKLSDKIPDNVTLLHRTYPEYYQHDERLGKFDFIIVDGRKRVRCLDTARKYLQEGGVVVLHDAGRERYEPGVSLYKKTVLSPSKNEKDPRGLFLLTEPKKRTRGVIYMAWGDNAIQESTISMKSLWKHEPDMPVMVLGDKPVDGAMFMKIDVNPFDTNQPPGYQFLAGRIKPLMARLSPFDDTLYVDADTEFMSSPMQGFDLLDRWDLVVAETEMRDLDAGAAGWDECKKTIKELKAPYLLYHNSGMIFWKKNERTEKLFDLWSEEWLRYQNWDEQVALLRALLRSDVMFLTVPYTWNHYDPEYMIHHQFGKGIARTDKKIMTSNIRDRNKLLRQRSCNP